MADNVEVKITADGGPAKSDMQSTSTSIQASLDGIKTALETFGSKNKDVVDQAVKNNADLSRSFVELKASATGGFNAITGVIERFRGVLATLTAALAGGFIGKEAVSEMLRLEDAVRGLTISFGMTTEKATQTAIALKLAGISADTYEQMGQRVGRVLKTQSEEFARLGVVTKDASGNLLPMDTILQNIFTRMQDFKAGTDQTEFALSTVGRNAKDFASDMLRLNDATARAAQLQHDLGIEMGPERIAAIEKYRQDVNAFTVVLSAIGDKIGESVLPNLEKLAAWFNEYGPTAINIVVGAIKVLLSILQVLGTMVGTAAVYAVSAFDKMVVSATAAMAVLRVRITQAWTEIPRIIAEANAKIAQINQTTAESVTQSWQGAADKIKAMWTDAPPSKPGGAGPMKSGSQHFTPKPTGGGDEVAAGLENELKAEEDAFNKKMLLQGSFQTWSITQTRDYWEEVLSMTNLSAKDRQAAENKYYDAERKVQTDAFAAKVASLDKEMAAYKYNITAKIALATQEAAMIAQKYGEESAQAQVAYKKIAELRQQLADQVKRIVEIQTATEEAHYTALVALEKQAADQQVALGQITNQQRLALEADFENQMYAKKLAALQRDRAAAGDDVILQATIDGKLEALEDSHQAALTKIANQGVLDREQYALQANKAIESDFSTLLSTLATGTKSIKQAFLDFFKSVSDGLAKIAADQVAKQFLGAGTQGGNFISSITSKIFGGAGAGAGAAGAATDTAHTAAVTADTTATTLQTTATTAQVTIGTTLTASFTALVAAANAAAAAMSAMGAQGAGSALGGLGGGFGDIIPSFAVGTPYVPQDSLAFVHRGEAIVPAKYNSGAGRGMFQANHFHFNITGNPDTRTMSQIEHAAARGQNRASVRAGS
jgi:hypothetical protein